MVFFSDVVKKLSVKPFSDSYLGIICLRCFSDVNVINGEIFSDANFLYAEGTKIFYFYISQVDIFPKVSEIVVLGTFAREVFVFVIHSSFLWKSKHFV